MRLLILAVALATIPGSALAISEYYSDRMPCQQVQSIIRDEGAAILRYRSRTNPSAPDLYGRYVAHGAYCLVGEVPMQAFVPATDNAQCPVSTCVNQVMPRRGGGFGGGGGAVNGVN